MIGAPEERRFFESCKAELLRRFPGHFAVICGRHLLGVYPSLDRALAAVADGFEDCNLPEGTPILITEIAEEVSLRVVASRAARERTVARAAAQP